MTSENGNSTEETTTASATPRANEPYLFLEGSMHTTRTTRNSRRHKILKASPINSIWITLLTYWTVLKVTIAHLITYDTIFVTLTSAGSVVCYSLITPLTENDDGEIINDPPLVAKLNLTFISFLIVFPVTANIGYAFARREAALRYMAGVKTYIVCMYVAHRDWAWAGGKGCQYYYSGRNLIRAIRDPDVTTLQEERKDDDDDDGDDDDDDGKKKLAKGVEMTIDESSRDEQWQADGGAVSRRHVDEVRHVCIKLIRAMRDFLSLPLVNRSRHLYTRSGKKMRNVVIPVQRSCLRDVYEQMQRLSLAVERMKEAGFPANEASRINQYASQVMRDWELLRAIKAYRTPTGLRCFARLYILVYPLFVGPYFAWVVGVGRDDDSSWPHQTNLGFAIALAVFTSVALQGLFNVEVGMEDPFDDSEGLDTVHVHDFFFEIEQILSMEWAPGVWNDTVMNGASIFDAKFSMKPGKIPKDDPREGLVEAHAAIM